MAALTLGVVGKGGVGKTTFAGLVARLYAERGDRVVAIDTDSNPNLGLSLGLSLADTDAVPVLPRSLMIGAGTDTTAAGLVAEYGRATPAGPTLLSAIRVAEAGAGCTCAGHATVRGLLAEALDDVDVTIVDMEAGLEHLSRSGGTLAYADVVLVVCEPTRKAVLTAARTIELAADLGIPHVLAVGNKARGPGDEDFLRTALHAAGLSVAGVLPWTSQIVDADRSGAPESGATESGAPDLVEIGADLRSALTQVVDAVDDLHVGSAAAAATG